MSRMRGLEMVAIGKEKFFEIHYEGGQYLNPRGEVVEDLVDMTCFNCGAAYYTFGDQMIEFCPACGQFERNRFERYTDLAKWARGQNWKFLKHTGNKVFGVSRGDGFYLAFAKDRVVLETRGVFTEINEIQTTAD